MKQDEETEDLEENSDLTDEFDQSYERENPGIKIDEYKEKIR